MSISFSSCGMNIGKSARLKRTPQNTNERQWKKWKRSLQARAPAETESEKSLVKIGPKMRYSKDTTGYLKVTRS